ncbi:putative WD-40 repeat protein [Rubrivivax sp. A210]|uniref:WD40 repeat domain-containing protein n=1 Tax=Rubrivivax sp. A210 TaxID=2772301 RepID=UPI00191A094B|nr:WD40 repeat domain-containing protein [Rubrivivax sp. A210]CAD5373486.1 putative WD-40 repeat protein [Rubrivivax sp. A210]
MSDAAALQLDDDNPWPGLEAYTEAAQRWFHGRDADSAELLRLIRQSPFVALYGKSGLGKSSMLQAGVFPALRAARFLPVYLRLDYTEGAPPPQLQALARLLMAVAETGADAAAPEPGERLWAYLQRRERPLWTPDNFPLTPVLVFDQFEEVFSRGGSPAHIRQMLDGIADLAGNRLPAELAEDREAARRLNLQSPQYHVVLSFRSDFLAAVEGWEKRANLPKREAHHLEAMGRETAIQAVQRAGAAVLVPGVAELIVDFVLGSDEAGGEGAATEVEPVLLSLCCFQLNNRRVRPARIDEELLRKAGQDILLDFYNEALAGMPARVSVFIEEQLIQGGRYRGNYPRQDAIDSGRLTAAELETLMKRRLLRVDPTGRVPRIELIHDRLVGIVRGSRDARLALEHQALLREESRKQAEEERDKERLQHAVQSRRRFRNALALLTVAFGLALASAYNAWLESGKAQQESLRAKALLMGTEAQGMLAGTRAGDDTRAYHYLLVAHDMVQDAQIEQPLLAALVARQHLLNFSPLAVPLDSDAVSLAYAPAGGMLAVGHLDGSVSLRPAARPQEVISRQAGHTELVQAVAFSPDGQHLASASDDGTLRLWQLAPGLQAQGEAIAVGQEQAVYSVAFNGDGSRLVSGGADGIVRLWNATSGTLLKELMPLPGAMVYGVAFNPDGRSVGAITSATTLDKDRPKTGSLYLLDPATLKPLSLIKGNPFFANAQDALSLAFSPSGRHAAFGGQDDTLRLRDLNDASQTAPRMGGRGGDMQSVVFSPDGRWLASGQSEGVVSLWQLPSGEALGPPLIERGGSVTSVAFSADGRWLAAAAEDSPLRLFALDDSWAPLGATIDAQIEPRLGALGRDGRWLLMLDRRGRLLLRDAGAVREMGALPAAPVAATPLVACVPLKSSEERAQASYRGGQRPQSRVEAPLVSALALSADGRRGLSGLRDGRLVLWDMEARAATATVVASGCPLLAVAISRDGHRMAVADSRGHLVVTDAAGRHIETRQGPPESINAIALSPDGNWLAMAGGPGALHLHRLGEGRVVALEGVFEDLSSLDFSPDGRQIVAGSTAGNVRVWDVQTRRPLGAPQEASRSTVAAVAFSADGQRFHSLLRSGASRPWPAPATWTALMCAKLGHNLSRRQWRDWVSPDLPYRCPCPGLPIAADPPDAAAAAASGAPAAPPEICPARG